VNVFTVAQQIFGPEVAHHASVVFAWASVTGVVLDALTRIVLIVRVILRRTPVPDTLSWIIVLGLVPLLSTALYLLIGENRLGSRRVAKYESLTKLIDEPAVAHWHEEHASIDESNVQFKHLTVLASNVTGLPPLKGNALELLGDAEHFISRLCDDIARSQRHCHLEFYIWEPDRQGKRVAKALCTAAQRGVACRVLVDSVGSADLLASELVAEMRSAGVRVVEALPAGVLRTIFARVDLRNHRKIAVIDSHIAYCGSQNITNDNFVKRKVMRAGPYVDATVRVRGPAVQALQTTFLHDWALDTDEAVPNIRDFLPRPSLEGDAVVHLVPSGPGPRPDAIHHSILAMLFVAREEIILTTPYFVPDEATKAGLINAALRGVHVSLIVPAVSDSLLVAAAARSHFPDLLEAGVKIHQHQQGLLHTKVMIVDKQFSVIGSANFDMRSFWLNFEATLIVHDLPFAAQLRALQQTYISQSKQVDLQQWRKRSILKRFAENSAQLLGPLL
jgi:cardiolipin synthase